MPTVAESFADQLAIAGVQRVYGLPGGENVEILDALRRQGMDFILVKNESSACFMAATDARLTGGIGVALATLGPGAANVFAGMAHACLDRAPVMLITAANDRESLGKHTHQVIDLGAVFDPICKLSAELIAENAAETIQQAIALMRADRPGPVHISIHNRIAKQVMPAAGGMASDRTAAPIGHGECSVDSSHIGAARKLLADKAKPVIIVGLGLEPSRPYLQLRRLAESLGAPVIDTPKSKGALSANHPLFAGAIGLTRDDPVYEFLDEADSIIAIGFDVVELVKPWDYKKPLIWIAEWQNHDPQIASDLELVGNISETLDAIGAAKAQTAIDWGSQRVQRFRAGLARRKLPMPAQGRILPQEFLASLRENTSDDITLTTDVGSHKILAALEWPARMPNRYFVSNGLSAMGFGLSSAIAAAETSGAPVVCITGDAGLAMALGELGLLTERQLPVLIALMNDSALDLIRSAQIRRGRPAFGTAFTNPDYEYIAKAYGIAYRKIASREDCGEAIRSWLSLNAPFLLDVMIDPAGYPTTVR
ncbi:MAG: thiamine pyrophosphate-binding protein [Chloroflexota bacterium]|nr:thiamine pyrophosphate-binding protein [Chloroflexota bacterium]MDE2910125.1 thiamine pyrophosphate-binding protein [Chloroflexota bacterium]